MSKKGDHSITHTPIRKPLFEKDEREDDTQYFIKESSLEELFKTREPVLMGHYKGDAVYAAIFSTMEQKYKLSE